MKTFNTVAEIKAERELQRQNPVIYSLLGVLLGEIDRLPIPRTQSPTEDQIYNIIKKLYEGAEYMASKDLSEESKIEYAYLKDYIKQQLSEQEIKNIVFRLMVQSNMPCNIGIVMKHFKDNYSGQYDGKLVSQIAKDML
jgi:uncharacterized protein YqeY